MSTRAPALLNDVKIFDQAGKLKLSYTDVIDRMHRGEQLILVRSEFEDSDDWSALYFDNELVGYWQGY